MMELHIAPGAFWDVVDDVTVVCDGVSGELYNLNRIAEFLWDRCDKTSVEALTSSLQAAFPGEDPDRIADDVGRFVESMIARNLLVTMKE